MARVPGRWRSFTIGGAEAKVRLVREYSGQRDSVWRDYQNDRGRVLCIQARRPGARRAETEKVTAHQAARRFAGFPS